MRKTSAFTVIFTILCSLPFTGWAGVTPQSHRTKLQQPAEIQGYPCAKGYAWFFTGGNLQRCTVSQEVVFAEARVPAESIIVLQPDGKPNYVFLGHDAEVAGYKCRGGGLLGPAEGPVTAFFPNGKLKVCWLASDQTVQGVPCRHASFVADTFSGDAGVYFHESGKLKSCKLSQDFGTQRRGQRFVQAP